MRTLAEGQMLVLGGILLLAESRPRGTQGAGVGAEPNTGFLCAVYHPVSPRGTVARCPQAWDSGKTLFFPLT